MSEDRRWMYEGWNNGKPNINWVRKTNDFVKRAFSVPNAERNGVLCPCHKCANYKRQNEHDMSLHLFKNGFMPQYLVWREHGEWVNASPIVDEGFSETDHWDEMLTDMANFHHPSAEDEAATIAAKNTFHRERDARQELQMQQMLSYLSQFSQTQPQGPMLPSMPPFNWNNFFGNTPSSYQAARNLHGATIQRTGESSFGYTHAAARNVGENGSWSPTVRTSGTENNNDGENGYVPAVGRTNGAASSSYADGRVDPFLEQMIGSTAN